MLEDDLRLEYIPVEEARQPKDGLLQCMIDYWWPVHPTWGIILFHRCKGTLAPNGEIKWMTRDPGSAQANKNRYIAERVRQQMYPWAEIRQIDIAFVRHFCDG